jgi:hypothetical protein
VQERLCGGGIPEQIIRMCNIPKRLCQQLLGGVAYHLAKSGIDSQYFSRLGSHLHLPNSGQLEIGSKLFFARAKGF